MLLRVIDDVGAALEAPCLSTARSISSRSPSAVNRMVVAAESAGRPSEESHSSSPSPSLWSFGCRCGLHEDATNDNQCSKRVRVIACSSGGDEMAFVLLRSSGRCCCVFSPNAFVTARATDTTSPTARGSGCFAATDEFLSIVDVVDEENVTAHCNRARDFSHDA